MRSILFFPILLLLASMAFAQQSTAPNPADYQNSRRPGLIENLGQVATPEGQPRPDVLFTGHGNGMQLFVFGNGISYQFTHIDRPEPPISEATGQPMDRDNPRDREAYREWERENTTVSTHRVHVELVDANPQPEVIKQAPTGYYENHYLAHCEVTGAKSYAKVTFKDVYPGIDWVLYRKGEYLKYDFLVHPGADPAQIQLAFTGADDLNLLPDGSLEIATTLGTVQENAPVSWYGDAKTPVESAFVLEDNTLHFALGEYDNTQPLTIDPTLLWGTYYGGSEVESGASVALGPTGVVYLAGEARSPSAIATPGSHQASYGGGTRDAFLAKFDSSGTRLWGTYYGGGDNDYGQAVALSPSGVVYLFGRTASTNAIATAGSNQSSFGGGTSDAFLAKFDSSGTRLWATYYGGSNRELGEDIAVDPSGAVYLTGETQSTNGIATPGSHQSTYGGGGTGGDAFLAKFDSNGTRLWGTYYGGGDNDDGRSVALEASGAVYLSGETRSDVAIATTGGHQPSKSGSYDSYLAKFNSSGTRLWATYYGGNSRDWGDDLAVAPSGEVYLGGYSGSDTSIATPASHQPSLGGGGDAFLAKFTSSGTRLWSTYYGGSEVDVGTTIALGPASAVFLAGRTLSANAIATPGSHQPTFVGGPSILDGDAFLAKFDSSGTRLWATYYGGSNNDLGEAVAVDPAGAVYVSGESESTDAIATSGSHQPIFGGGNFDAFLVKFEVGTILRMEESTTTLPFTLHPNPSTGEVNITGDFRPGQALQLRVLDLNGRVVQEEALNTPSTHLNLPAGVYIIEVRQGEQLGREKVVLR